MNPTRFVSDPPGVHRVDPADGPALLAQVQLGRHSVVRIDLGTALSKAAVMAALASALHLPDHFGGNLDALADCLTDPDYAPTGVVFIDHLNDRAGLMREDLLEVFEDAIAARVARQAPFWVYWSGA